MSIQNYTPIEILGKGGFGVVEKVIGDDGLEYARKTFAPNVHIQADAYPKFKKRFKREVLTQKRLGGECVIPVLDSDLNDDSPWFIMPLATKVYSQEIKDNQFEGAVEITPIADIINALEVIHEKGFVHRDLNPNNILLEDGKWKLSDLGAILPPSGATLTLTDNTIILTEKYCAPEQRNDFHNAKPPADIYSFGCILHDIFGIGDRVPYQTHSAKGKMGLIIEKCTAGTPSKRPSLTVLRSLVLSELVEAGGHCKVEDVESSEWLERLEDISDWDSTTFDDFARFFAGLDLTEKTSDHSGSWVYSTSTPFLTRIPDKALKHIVKRQDQVAGRIVEKYCDWAANTNFEFNFADTVSDRLSTIFDSGSEPDKALSFASMVSLAYSHNRWYVIRHIYRRSIRENISYDLGQRLAIELQTEELEREYNYCLKLLKCDPEKISPDLQELCS